MFYESESVKIHRTFVLEEETTNQTKVVALDICIYREQADLFPVFSYALKELKGVQIRIYDFKANKYVDLASLGLRYHVPASLLDNNSSVVLIKYSYCQAETLSLSSYVSENNLDARSDTLSKKTERSKERVILQVVQIVRKWRRLCDTKRGSSMTLAEAASVVGLPKKSLDDYYYQLRMGEKYGFDYHAHIMERIGVLRSFLKQFKTHRRGDKNEKLPNHLHIVEQIDGYEDLLKEHTGNPCSAKDAEEEQEKVSHSPEQETIKEEHIEKDFYAQFNYNNSRELDPFLSLGGANHMEDEEDNYSNDFEVFF